MAIKEQLTTMTDAVLNRAIVVVPTKTAVVQLAEISAARK
jgi:hypothetical protein